MILWCKKIDIFGKFLMFRIAIFHNILMVKTAIFWWYFNAKTAKFLCRLKEKFTNSWYFFGKIWDKSMWVNVPYFEFKKYFSICKIHVLGEKIQKICFLKYFSNYFQSFTILLIPMIASEKSHANLTEYIQLLFK